MEERRAQKSSIAPHFSFDFGPSTLNNNNKRRGEDNQRGSTSGGGGKSSEMSTTVVEEQEPLLTFKFGRNCPPRKGNVTGTIKERFLL